jgi:hypothetical protein
MNRLNEILNIVLKSNPSQYYLQEGLLFENPNQAIKFLKEKNLDPTNNQKGKEILDSINNITKGDGYTHLLTKFLVNERMPLSDIQKLHDYLIQNKQHITRLPKPVVTYANYRELKRDLDDMESMRQLKRLYNELSTTLKQQYATLSELEKQGLKELANKYNTILTPEQQNFFIKKVSGYKDIRTFISNLRNYINSIENKEDFNSIQEKINNTSGADIIYNNSETNIIIASIKSFEASKTLGCTTNWCITRDFSYWKQYKAGKNYYFFIWDFNYPAENVNYLVGTAYDQKNPEHSTTHLKDDRQTNLDKIVKEKNLNFDIFNNYIVEYKKKLVDAISNTSDSIMSVIKNGENEPDLLITSIQSSNIVTEYGDESKVEVLDNNVYIGLTPKEIIEYFDIDYSDFNWIQGMSEQDAYNMGYYSDEEELNYIKNYLNDDNLNLLKDIAKNFGYDRTKINDFDDEDGAIKNFIEKYELDDIKDVYLGELELAHNEAEIKEANNQMSKIPFDFDNDNNVKFVIDDMVEYVVNNEINAMTFDDLIDQIKNNLPDFSIDTVSEAGWNNADYDNLNRKINDELVKILNDLDDPDSEYYVDSKISTEVDNELKRLKFDFVDTRNSFAQKEMKNGTLFINNVVNNSENNEPYINATIEYKDDKKPSKKVKIPIKSLKNYIDQSEIPFNIKEHIIKLIKKELEMI